MESLITKMNDLYQKEKRDKSNNGNSPNAKNNKNLIEKVYVIDKNSLNGEEIKKKINNEFNLPTFQKEKELLTYIENKNIPIKYLNKIIKEIFKYNNKDIIIKFVLKYKDKLTEKNLLLIFKKLNDFDNKNLNEIIENILNNILIDEKYFLQLLKEEKLDLNKEIIESMNICLNKLKDINNKIGLLELIKALNLKSLLKEVIEKDEYTKYENNINEIFCEELNKRENKKEICEEEFNNDFNMDFINSMKIINSNPNKAYFIQEKIII